MRHTYWPPTIRGSCWEEDKRKKTVYAGGRIWEAWDRAWRPVARDGTAATGLTASTSRELNSLSQWLIRQQQDCEEL